MVMKLLHMKYNWASKWGHFHYIFPITISTEWILFAKKPLHKFINLWQKSRALTSKNDYVSLVFKGFREWHTVGREGLAGVQHQLHQLHQLQTLPCAPAPLRCHSCTETVARPNSSLVKIQICPPLDAKLVLWENVATDAILIWQILNKPHALAVWSFSFPAGWNQKFGLKGSRIRWMFVCICFSHQR